MRYGRAHSSASERARSFSSLSLSHTQPSPFSHSRDMIFLMSMSVSETPLVDHSALGLEEYEPGVYEDTFESRKRLREAGYQWRIFTDCPEDAGLALLQVIDQAADRRDSRERLRRKQYILDDPTSEFSEYLSPLELTHDAEVPFWVKTGARRWEAALAHGEDPAARGLWLPVRCVYVKRSGTRCWSWSGTTRAQIEHRLCRTHLLSTDVVRETSLTAARQRVYQAAPHAVDTLEHLMLAAEAEPVRLRAAESLLDRAGVRGGTEVDLKAEVTHVDSAAAIRERLLALSPPPQPALPVLEAEVVPE